MVTEALTQTAAQITLRGNADEPQSDEEAYFLLDQTPGIRRFYSENG